jgi:hypothetical protein
MAPGDYDRQRALHVGRRWADSKERDSGRGKHERCGAAVAAAGGDGPGARDRAYDRVRADAAGELRSVKIGVSRRIPSDAVAEYVAGLSPSSFRQVDGRERWQAGVRASGSPRPRACGCSARRRTVRGRCTGRRMGGGVRPGGCPGRGDLIVPWARRSRRPSGEAAGAGRARPRRPPDGRAPGRLVVAQRLSARGAAVVVGQG